MYRSPESALLACRSICQSVRTLIPTSANLNIHPNNELAIFLMRYKTKTQALLEEAKQLKRKKIYKLSKNQILSLLGGLIDDKHSLAYELEKIGITPKNHSRAFYTLLKFLIELRSTFFENDCYHNDNSTKNSETMSEQVSKRALKSAIGNCGELVEVIRTYVKLFYVPELSGFSHFSCEFDDHVLLVFFDHSKELPADFFKKRFGNFNAFCHELKKHTAAILVDPWINLVVDLTEYRALLTVSKNIGLEKFFQSVISQSDFLPCLKNSQSSFLSDRHQPADKHQKYETQFLPLHTMVAHSSIAFFGAPGKIAESNHKNMHVTNAFQ